VGVSVGVSVGVFVALSLTASQDRSARSANARLIKARISFRGVWVSIKKNGRRRRRRNPALAADLTRLTRLCSRKFCATAPGTCPREGETHLTVPYIQLSHQLPWCVSWPSPAHFPSRWPIASYFLAFEQIHVPQGCPVCSASPRARVAAILQICNVGLPSSPRTFLAPLAPLHRL